MLRESCQSDIDFDVVDALEKVRDFGLVDGEVRLVARPLSPTLVQLDQRWDAIFDHRSPTPAVPEDAPGCRTGQDQTG